MWLLWASLEHGDLMVVVLITWRLASPTVSFLGDGGAAVRLLMTLAPVSQSVALSCFLIKEVIKSPPYAREPELHSTSRWKKKLCKFQH